MAPIISYNYGIKRYNRVKKTMNLALWGCAALMCVLLIIFEIFSGTVLTMFSAGEQMREIGMICPPACVISLSFRAVSMILSTNMQALDHSRYAMVINLLRQCVLLIGCFAVISAITHSQKLIWFAVPITEIVTFAVSLLLNRRFRKDLMD